MPATTTTDWTARAVPSALTPEKLAGLVDRSLDAVEAGMLTERHVRAVIAELDKVRLSLEQRQAIVWVLLARFDADTPGELARLVRRLIVTVDRAAAQSRQDIATRGRRVQVFDDVDGQGVLHARGPVAVIAAIKARLRAELHGQQWEPGDERNTEQREFDLLVDLLTRGTLDDQPVAPYAVQVIVPFSTATGGDLELGEIAGYGPILPSTARDLLSQSDSVSQVAVDQDGNVIAVSDPMPGPATARTTAHTADRDAPAHELGVAVPVDFLREALRAMTSPPLPRSLSTSAYRPSSRLSRLVAARDRTCVFPGCHRRITDKDHRIPWPLGPTDAHNLQCLCRHHHRAKQAAFTVELTTDGDYRWTTRGGWQFLRKRQGYCVRGYPRLLFRAPPQTRRSRHGRSGLCPIAR